MAARRKKSQDDAPGGPGHARRGRRRAYPLDPLDGEPATLPPPSQRDCFVPAADTVPNPPGKSESTSSQWYPQEIDGLNKLCRGFTHYFGVKISHSLVQRAFLWVLLTSGPALLTRVFHQIERLYWKTTGATLDPMTSDVPVARARVLARTPEKTDGAVDSPRTHSPRCFS